MSDSIDAFRVATAEARQRIEVVKAAVEEVEASSRKLLKPLAEEAIGATTSLEELKGVCALVGDVGGVELDVVGAVAVQLETVLPEGRSGFEKACLGALQFQKRDTLLQLINQYSAPDLVRVLGTAKEDDAAVANALVKVIAGTASAKDYKLAKVDAAEVEEALKTSSSARGIAFSAAYAMRRKHVQHRGDPLMAAVRRRTDPAVWAKKRRAESGAPTAKRASHVAPG